MTSRRKLLKLTRQRQPALRLHHAKVQRGSMSGRGRSNWPGRGGQSTRGRGGFQNRQEQAPPATPPPSPRLASQNDRIPTRGQTFFHGRGRGRGSACWVCQLSDQAVTVGIIHRWRTVIHRQRLRLMMTVRQCAVHPRRGLDAMSVVHTAAIQTSTGEMLVTFTSLHRSSRVKFNHQSRSWKTSFGVRVRANGLRLFLRARALIRSSVGLRPTDT